MAVEGTEAYLRLAAACCRPSGAARDEAVRSAAAGITDWPLFLSTLRRHRIEAVTQAALSAAQVALPDDVAASLKKRAQAIAQRNLAMAAEAARLQGLLGAVGVPSLVLKGAALAQLAWGSVAIKFSQDIDLLIAPEARDRAIVALERDGYRLLRPLRELNERQRELVAAHGREIALQRPDGDVQVELRWQAVNSPSLLKAVDARAPHQVVSLGDAVSVRTLNDDDLFAYLCVHGAGHGWSRMQWLADLNAFIARRDEAGLLRLYRHAKGIGAGPCALLALALCNELLGRALPPGLEASRRIRVATALSLDLLNGPEVRTRRFGTTRIALIQLLIGTGARYYVDLACDLAFRLNDMLALPLPRGLRFLYPLSRVPLWLWRKVSS